MSDVDILRRAAALMRERAEAARASFPDSVPEWYTVGALMGAGKTRADSEHIASWHPGVAVPIADWLESAARAYEALAADCTRIQYLTPHSVPTMAEAWAAARAYLGESA